MSKINGEKNNQALRVARREKDGELRWEGNVETPPKTAAMVALFSGVPTSTFDYTVAVKSSRVFPSSSSTTAASAHFGSLWPRMNHLHVFSARNQRQIFLATLPSPCEPLPHPNREPRNQEYDDDGSQDAKDICDDFAAPV